MGKKFTLVDEDGNCLLDNLNAETSEDAIKELESRGILIDIRINETDKELICRRSIVKGFSPIQKEAVLEELHKFFSKMKKKTKLLKRFEND